MSAPSAARVLEGLKDFQRDTVEHAFRRLWTDDDFTKRFLVADEVGLGKTMIAKGVIAKTVEHLWDTEDRIDIVYICSNTQIARQNLSRLNEVGGKVVRHADRLTLLPTVLKELRGERVNFVSFTPGTSFDVGNQGGKYEERVMLYWMLAEAWGREAVSARRWLRFFQATMSEHNFKSKLKDFDRGSLDPELVATFAAAVERESGPDGAPLREELEACVDAFNYLRNAPDWRLSNRRNRLIGALRHLVSQAAVEHLEPDLVILDEFQRFKDVLGGNDPAAELARAVFDHRKARVLLLSATPFKMYTLPDEPAGEDHYADFQHTVSFLAGADRASQVQRDLRTMRTAALGGEPTPNALEARSRVEHELRRVMSRHERLASTPDRSGMLAERPMPGVSLSPSDVRSWLTFDGVARQLDRHDVFEYWRSAPYPLNVMDRGSYSIRKRFEAALEGNDPAVVSALRHGSGLLDPGEMTALKRIDPGNAKLRGLMTDVLDRGAWRLAWIPPSMPYHGLRGAYAEPDLRNFTKRLIFSAWTVVPKAIAVMMSYEAERLALEAGGGTDRTYAEHRQTTPPLQYGPSGTAVTLLYPSVFLAEAGDPLTVARALGAPLPIVRDDYEQVVRDRVRGALGGLAFGPTSQTSTDARWYWVAPALLDRLAYGASAADWVRGARTVGDGLVEEGSRLKEHLNLLSRLDSHVPGTSLDALGLGTVPDDLEDVLVAMAVGSPAVTALRALSRVAGGPAALPDTTIRVHALKVALGLRSMFNRPEIVPLLRAEESTAYWREVLKHCADGCLQAVLDEYTHVLVESEGLQRATDADKAARVADTMSKALTLRAAANTIEGNRVVDGRIETSDHNVASHFAARYGRQQTADQAVVRESQVRDAYNSPFRPFVLASTSVGQEGLDFHTYSHAIVHWNLPSNPVDLEQREGRVHRYKGHAVRKNVARDFGDAALREGNDPWAAVFDDAVAAREGASSEVIPFWVYAPEGGSVIERYVPAMPLSRELQHYRRLQRTVVAYRQLLGQPRQDDLVAAVGEDAEWMRVDLAPPTSRSIHDAST